MGKNLKHILSDIEINLSISLDSELEIMSGFNPHASSKPIFDSELYDYLDNIYEEPLYVDIRQGINDILEIQLENEKKS